MSNNGQHYSGMFNVRCEKGEGRREKGEVLRK